MVGHRDQTTGHLIVLEKNTMLDSRQKRAGRHDLVIPVQHAAVEYEGQTDHAAKSRRWERALWRHAALPLLVLANAVALPMPALAQLLLDLKDPSTPVAATVPAPPAVPYMRPTAAMKLHNYLFDSLGPYPILGAAIAAGINQSSNSPPEWKQGAEAYGRRFGSNFGIAAVTTTTRYALAEAFREDTLYYRCDCKGVSPRLRHAAISTLTARRGKDGHRVFSFPALVAPYAGAMTAVYGWYPSRYGAKDALRMGNYTLLGYVGVNIAREFLHSLFSRLHLNKRPTPPNPGSKP